MNEVIVVEPQSNTVIVAHQALTFLSAEGVPASALIRGEVPSGLVNGINASFTSQFPFIPESLSPYLNGLRLKIVEDYQVSGNRTVLLNISPQSGESLLIDYVRSDI